MKIAIIRKKYNPFGGAERYLNLLASHLVREGHDVHIFANKWPAGTNNGVTFHKIPMIGGLSLLKVWSFAIAAWFILKRFDGDVIFSNERLFAQDILRTSDGVHRTWLKIRMRHSSPLRKLSFIINPLHLSIRFFDRFIFKRRAFRKIIAPSEFIKRDIIRTYDTVNENDIQVIYNGVDLERFRPDNKKLYRDAVRSELGIPHSTCLLLFVGTGFERKGLRYAIGALRHLPQNTILAVIGKGNTRRCMGLARQWGLNERVKFIGPVDGVERYYASADLVVAPALYEPMANVMLEALATGIPVVTSRDCGNSEVVSEGKDGWLINDPADDREIALKIKSAIAASQNPEAERCARKKAEQFTLQRTIGEIRNVISMSSILFLMEGKNTPSSRLRVGNYLPYLNGEFSCKVQHIPGSFHRRLRFLWNLPRVDLIFLQKKLFRPWELSLISRHCRRIIYDFDDAVIYKDSQEDSESAVKKSLIKRFKTTIRETDIVIAGNEYLADMVKPWAKRIEILPTPVDLKKYKPKIHDTGSGEVVTIGWVGTRGNLKYLKELTPVLQQLAQHYPAMQVKVVCDAAISIPGVTLVHQPWSLENEVQDLQSFDVGIMPLHDNLWTRGKCGYKILQYMAVGIPTVASSVGFNKTLIQEGHNGFLASTPDEWFRNLSRLLMEPELRKFIGMNGRKTVEEKYSLDRCGMRFKSILQETG